ncbi:hypothetical protein [Wolbachia endosymbiont of Folsomia candida]|uniref:hypothetical protein n=1 Tax=Wolbachia endosymbiont of Folsomia candida TaxID=169402 RepID=UPI000AD71C85|nr:hypothetical protein [Wolbachia endosymbiont of Folsomia candida]
MDKSAVSDIVHITDKKLNELLNSAKSHLNTLSANKENSVSVITAAKTESLDEINTLRANSLDALKTSSDSYISLLDTRKDANIAAINSVGNDHRDALKGVVEGFRAVNDVPSGSSIMKEVRNRNMVEPESLPFLFGVLGRFNDANRGHGHFKSELGQWYKDTTQTNHMLSLLAGTHTYNTSYVGFYRPPSIYFLQGKDGTFIYRESYVRYTGAFSDSISYPYALLGAIFIKNTTKADITRVLNFVGSSYWDSQYEGAGMFVGTPDNTNTNQEEISTIIWKNVYNNSSSSEGFADSCSVIAPAEKTVVVLFYSSPYHYGMLTSHAQFMQWGIYSFRSNFLTTGLEVDVERTLKAWQCPGLEHSYQIWN